jgi:hypothetical protein
VQDLFSWSMAQRRRAISDLPWFGLAFVTAGLGSATTWWGEWPWMALSIVSVVVGVALLVRSNRSRGTRA